RKSLQSLQNEWHPDPPRRSLADAGTVIINSQSTRCALHKFATCCQFTPVSPPARSAGSAAASVRPSSGSSQASQLSPHCCSPPSLPAPVGGADRYQGASATVAARRRLLRQRRESAHCQ